MVKATADGRMGMKEFGSLNISNFIMFGEAWGLLAICVWMGFGDGQIHI